MRAVEGSLLVVDASQGVEAQTLANVYQAIDAGHEIVPVLNKIDLPAAEPDRVREQIEDVIGIDASRRRRDLRQDRPGHPRRARGHRHPPPRPQGRPGRAAQGDAGRLLVRRLPRRRRARPHLRRPPAQGRPHPHDADRRPLRASTASASSAPACCPPTRSAPARSASSPPRSSRSATPASATPSPTSASGAADAAPRLQALDPGGLLRPLPGRRRRLRGPARRHREAAAQRRLLHLRDGDLRRPRLRLPLRLPRPPPPRGDPRAPRARVRPRPHHHRPLGRSTASTRPTAPCSSCTTPPTCPTRCASTTSRSRASRRPSSSPTTTSATS